MATLPRPFIALLLMVLSAHRLLAQTVTNAPNQNNGAVTKVEPTIWETPFLWIGIVVFGLALVLLFLKKGKTETIGRKHVERKSGTHQ